MQKDIPCLAGEAIKSYKYDKVRFGMDMRFNKLLLHWGSYAVFFHSLMLVVRHRSQLSGRLSGGELLPRCINQQ